MLWQLLIAIGTIITSPFRAPIDPDHLFVEPDHLFVDPDIPYEATEWGPQSWEAALRARQALQGEHDDILHPIDGDPSYAGINGSSFRWPNKTLVYFMEPAIKNDQRMVKLIKDAIKQYQAKTCLKFKERTNELAYVRIFKDPGQCYSRVGKQWWQPQDMSLDDDCGYIGTVVHEFGHALGLYHEHQRSDRDTYITVHGNNVMPGLINNFNTTKKIDELTFGAKYDYTSIMHYGECAFTKNETACPTNKSLWTMEAKDGKTRLLEPYDKPGLNQNDITLIRKLYNC